LTLPNPHKIQLGQLCYRMRGRFGPSGGGGLGGGGGPAAVMGAIQEIITLGAKEQLGAFA